MVWDRIHARDGRAAPVEEWGGISYALAAATAAAPPEWTLTPIIKVGSDLAEQAFRFLRSLPGADVETGVRIVNAPNNRVELRYTDSERRAERLTGGVPPWTWDELAPVVAQLDALYINFISGFELELETALRLRHEFSGPIYADLHSIFLAVEADGLRTPRPLDAWREWLRCFDAVQVNEDELGLLAHAWSGDPWRFAAEMVNDDLKLLLVTMGQRGAAYVASDAFHGQPLEWQRTPPFRHPLVAPRGAARSERVAVSDGVRTGDPTGCGDVWGATFFTRMVAGADLHTAMRVANEAAARNVQHRGATGLHLFLSGRIGA